MLNVNYKCFNKNKIVRQENICNNMFLPKV